MRKSTVGTAILATVAFTFLTGFGFGHRHGCGKDTPEAHEKRMTLMATMVVEDVLDDLDATDEQRQQVHAIKRRMLKEAPVMMMAHKQAKQEMTSQWLAEEPNTEKIHQLIDARAAEMQSFAHRVADAIIDLHRILTPEQRQELIEEYGHH